MMAFYVIQPHEALKGKKGFGELLSEKDPEYGISSL